MRKIFFILFFVFGYVAAKAQILGTKERSNYCYFLYTDTIPAKNIIRGLPRGANLQYANGQKQIKSLTQKAFITEQKIVFWYRHNMLLQQCRFVLLQNGKQVSALNFWADAELVVIDTKLLQASNYKILIKTGDTILEQKEIVLSSQKE